jgi:hypothetical protein
VAGSTFSSVSYDGAATLLLLHEDGSEHPANVHVILRATLPGVFELHFPAALTAAQAPVWLRVTLPDGQTYSGAVRYLAPGTLTFRLDAEEPA